MRGLLITLEGIDGSGKTTILRMISGKLIEAFPERRFVFTAEPTSGKAGELLRKALLSQKPAYQEEYISNCRKVEELFLFLADHADHLARAVMPALIEGAVVISDRYADSTSAYQGVTLRGLVPDPVSWISSISLPWNTVPDQTLLFDLEPSLAIERIRGRHGSDKDPEKFEHLEFLKEVYNNFRRLAEESPGRFVSIDATRPMPEVADEALEAIINLIYAKTEAL
jgi:dTMP kinase